MQGPGLLYYNLGDSSGPSMGLSEFGRTLRDKFKNYMNKRKGYQLTKTTEDSHVYSTKNSNIFIIKIIFGTILR